MATHTCDCGQHYAVNLSTRLAKPGKTVTHESVVPTEDIYGRHLGWRTVTSGHWVSEGEPVAIEQQPDNGEVVWTYQWACSDHTTTYEVPAYDVVPCRSCKSHDRRNHGGYYSKYAPTCSCCGGNPRHSISRDPQARHLPACIAREHNAA